MLDSDIANADSMLHVEFYLSKLPEYDGKPFVRIMVPGDKTNIIDQPVRDDHKERFPRQWLHFQMQQSEGAPVIGTPLSDWHSAAPHEFSRGQMEELQILKFQTVEQVATASDAHIQRIGMGGAGLRERARMFLQQKNRAEANKELQETRAQLAALQEQMRELVESKRKRKED
jgi:hypothetical protein